MSKINLEKYGITGTTEIVYNPSYEVLFEEETKAGLEGYEVGQESELGAVNVMTGIYTGRSPKDKYIVMDENSKDTVWWTSDEYKNDIKKLKDKNTVVLNLHLLDKEQSQRTIDFVCGAAHALNGTAQKISDMVFIFTPSNVSLSVENGATQSKFAESLWNKPL